MLSMSLLLVSGYQKFVYISRFIRSCFLFQAILGGTIQVPTLSGDVVVKVCQM